MPEDELITPIYSSFEISGTTIERNHYNFLLTGLSLTGIIANYSLIINSLILPGTLYPKPKKSNIETPEK